MAKSAASYASSRWNALQFGTHQDGPLRCPGKGKCRYRYCDGGGYPSSPDGDLCLWEVEYATRIEVDFHKRWDVLAILDDVDDLESCVIEAVNIALQRGRAMTRMNHSWIVRQDNDDQHSKSAKEFDLANLYLERLDRRQERLEATLQAGLERMQEREDRLRPHLQVIELLVLGWKHAAAG